MSDNVDHIKLLVQTLKPDWLQLKVLYNLLDMYDDYLLPPNHLYESPRLDLTRVVTHYFYMLPPLKQEECNSVHKKAKVVLHNAIR